MHNLYYKGRIEIRENHVKSGYNTKRDIKLGTEESPLTLVVASEQRQTEVEARLTENNLVANITIDADSPENIIELDALLNKPQTTRFEKTPQRNDPCSCGSGKKYKKCCS
ncbi:MAG: SEC-C domain-containing protein [Gammaproteobacteria bacterium]|nr:SEC-C domain-containing protein [Gammaproteobacteria bacterium]